MASKPTASPHAWATIIAACDRAGFDVVRVTATTLVDRAQPLDDLGQPDFAVFVLAPRSDR